MVVERERSSALNTLFLFLLVTCCAFTGSAQDSFNFSDLDRLEQYVLDHPGITASELPSDYREILPQHTPALISPSDQPDAACDETVAGAVAIGSWFLGIGIILPIHRWIIGGYGVGNSCLYICTLGGCGCLPLIDGIVLLVSGDSGRYCGCDKFFLFSCKPKSTTNE